MVLTLCQGSCGGVGQPLAPMEWVEVTLWQPLRRRYGSPASHRAVLSLAAKESKTGREPRDVVEPGSTPGVWVPSRWIVDDWWRDLEKPAPLKLQHRIIIWIHEPQTRNS